MTEDERTVNVAIPPELHKALKVFAAQNETKVKTVVCLAIEAYLKQNK